jgi:hypothetical protein
MNRNLEQPELQNLPEGVACNRSRQRLGVRLSSAAFICDGLKCPHNSIASIWDPAC